MIAEVEVYGLDFDEFDSMTKINEEKLLLIGRNALFTYYSIRDEDGWRSVEEERFDTVYLHMSQISKVDFGMKESYYNI